MLSELSLECVRKFVDFSPGFIRLVVKVVRVSSNRVLFEHHLKGNKCGVIFGLAVYYSPVDNINKLLPLDRKLFIFDECCTCQEVNVVN